MPSGVLFLERTVAGAAPPNLPPVGRSAGPPPPRSWAHAGGTVACGEDPVRRGVVALRRVVDEVPRSYPAGSVRLVEDGENETSEEDLYWTRREVADRKKVRAR